MVQPCRVVPDDPECSGADRGAMARGARGGKGERGWRAIYSIAQHTGATLRCVMYLGKKVWLMELD